MREAESGVTTLTTRTRLRKTTANAAAGGTDMTEHLPKSLVTFIQDGAQFYDEAGVIIYTHSTPVKDHDMAEAQRELIEKKLTEEVED